MKKSSRLFLAVGAMAILLLTTGVLWNGDDGVDASGDLESGVGGAEQRLSDVVLPEAGALSRPSTRQAVSQGELVSSWTGKVLVQAVHGGSFVALAQGRVIVSQDSEQLSIDVSDGKWEVPAKLADGGDWMVSEVWGGERKLGFLPRPMSSNEVGVLHAYSYEGFFIAVRSELGRLIDGVHVRRKPYGSADSREAVFQHPGNLGMYRRVPHEHSNPFYLPRLSEGSPGYWVSAPGRCWRMVRASETGGDDLLDVTLQPGASLRISVEDLTYQKEQRIHVVSKGEHLATYRIVDVGTVMLEGLPPGEVTAELSFSSYPTQGSAVDRAPAVQLVAGRITDVSLRMPEIPGLDQRGRVLGTLTVELPELWEDSAEFGKLGLSLNQEPPSPGFSALRQSSRVVHVNQMEVISPSRAVGQWEWSMEEIPAGEYYLELSPLGMQFPVSVEAKQATEVQCVVPPVAKTVVDVRHEGDAVAAKSMSAVSYWAGRSQVLQVQPDKNGVFTLVSLPGELYIRASVRGLRSVSKRVSVRAGWNHVHLDAEKLASVTMRSVDEAGGEVSLDWWFDVTAQAVGGSRGELVDRSVEAQILLGSSKAAGQRVTFLFSEPGEYRLQFPSLPDGRSAKDLIVTAGLDERALVDVVVARSASEGGDD